MGIKIIDVGCGDYKFEGAIGIDARESLKEKYGDEIIIHDLNKGLPLPDESVEMIIASHVMEHLYHPEEMLKEFYRVLKKGGMVYCWYPVDDLINDESRGHGTIDGVDTGHHVSMSANWFEEQETPLVIKRKKIINKPIESLDGEKLIIKECSIDLVKE